MMKPLATQIPPVYYQIRVKGHLDPEWSTWFDGMTISHEHDGVSLLAGIVVDQAALYGLISRARDLGLTLVSITQSDVDSAG